MEPTQAAPGGFFSAPSDLIFIALLFALFVVPKFLQRYRIPDAVTCLLLGFAAAAVGFERDNQTVELLSTFGITALFLFAGLDIDSRELRRDVRTLVQHIVAWSTLMLVVAVLAGGFFHLPWRAAALVSLALVTPSTGFILSSRHVMGLTDSEQFTVKTKAVGSEMVALAALFVIVQTTSWQRFLVATVTMVVVVAFIPFAFRVFATRIAPFAPRSEFAFLLMVAVVCAYATQRLGVYYLVGAFLVGVAAQRFRAQVPAMSSEKMVDALEAFGSVFIPFYFFAAGTHVEQGQVEWTAAAVAAVLLVVMTPVRVAVVATHRRWALDESSSQGRRIGIALLPTLVFTLVLTSILHERYPTADWLVGALAIYTVVNTILPAFVLRGQPPEFTEPMVEPASELDAPV